MQTCRSCQSANLDKATACSVCGESLENFTIAEAPTSPPPGGQPSGYATPQLYGPPQQPGYGAPPQPGTPPYGPPSATVYAPPGTPGGYAQTTPTNNLAISSLVVSILGILGAFACFFPIVLAPIGAILGHVSLRQIKTSGQQGRGLALAGIIVGWVATALAAAGVVLLIVVLGASGSSNY